MIKQLIKVKKIRSKTLIFLFLVAIYAPLIGSILKLGVNSDESILSSELRPAAKAPSLKLIISHPPDYLREVEQYYNDHFGFRKTLIEWYGIAKVLWLGESPSSKVIVGKKGWLFLSNAGDQNELKYYRSTNLFTSKELADWKHTLEQRNNRLASQGIHYLLVIAPNKTTIYPEFLPTSINRVKQESRLDQLIAYMKANSNVKILDLRDSLRLAKTNDLIYARRNTHWNDLGAFVAYQQMIKSLDIWYPNMKALPRSDFKLQVTYDKADLINMVGLTDIIKDEKLSLIPHNLRLAHRADPGIYRPDLPEYEQPFATELKDSSLPRSVMFRDSFTERLAPFISEHFKRIVYLWQDEFDQKIVQKEHPNIVIQEIVERKLMSIHPSVLNNSSELCQVCK